ncbi:MAG: M23 family metallopeptidase, partial [bacterium]
GYVSRIVVGPSGYGKMLWLRHPDGYYTTYAHLRNFNDAIDAAVNKEQLRLQRYPITIDCNPSDFPVQKGDVIAFTGETGTGSPHLHFEIRDENKDFINPLLCKQFTFADDSIPRINRIALSPLGENSLIEGSFDDYTVSVRNPIRPSITLAETLHASGTFGFSVDARDRINFSRFRNGVYSHKLFLDDSLIYSVQLNRAPSTDDYQIGLYYDYGLMSEEEGRYEKLYMDSPNRLPFYQPKQVGAGIINTEKFTQGVHHFKIISSDFARNTTQVTGTIVFYQPYDISIAASKGLLSIIPAPEDLHLRFRMFAKSSGKRKPAWKQYDITTSRQPFDYSKIARTSDVLRVVALDSLGSPSLPRFIYPRRADNATSGIEFDHQIHPDYVRILVRTKTQFSSPPYLVLSEGNASRNIVLTPVDDDAYAGTFKPQEGFNGTRTVTMVNGKGSKEENNYQIDLYPLIPTHSAEIRFDNGNLIVNADSASMFRTTFMEIRKKHGSQNAYSLLPRFAIVDRGLTIKLRSENSSANEAIYFRGRSSRWSLLQTERSGNYLVAQLT